MVIEDEVTSPIFDLCQCTEGWLAVTTNVSEAHIIIDEMVSDTTATANEPIYIQVDTGPRHVSAYRQGYKTLYPQLINVMAMPDDTVDVTLSLEVGQEGNQVGDLGFDFTLENDFSDMISLHNHRGHIVLVNYWFSTCQPCMEEFPEIEQIYQDYSPDGLRILALNPMVTDDLETVQQVRSGLGLSFQLLLDYGGDTYLTYGVDIWPTNFIIGPGGEIVERLGSTTYEELAGIIEGLMGQ
jgi:peroxiredoxin